MVKCNALCDIDNPSESDDETYGDAEHQQQQTQPPVTRPAWGRGTSFPSCPFSSPSFALFYFFFLGGFNYFLFLSIPFLSTS